MLHDEVANHARLKPGAGSLKPFFTDVVERADVRMVQRGDRPRLTIESLAELRIRGERFRQDLDRDRALQPRVARSVHFTHSTGAKWSLDFVRSEA